MKYRTLLSFVLSMHSQFYLTLAFLEGHDIDHVLVGPYGKTFVIILDFLMWQLVIIFFFYYGCFILLLL